MAGTTTRPEDGQQDSDFESRLLAAAQRAEHRSDGANQGSTGSTDSRVADNRRETAAATAESTPNNTGSPGGKDGAAADSPEQRELVEHVAEGLKKPALAPGIQLRGEMKESAFVEAPWLIVHNGKFIQLPEIQYRIAEQVNGERNLEEIAESASEATGRKISKENAQTLIGNLMKLNVVAIPDVTDEEDERDEDEYKARSPLAINMRVGMIGPKFIEPFTRIFQYLYLPPVVLTLVALAIAGQAWLFFVHGLGGSLQDAFYTPTLFLAAIGIVVVAAAFHEFGHATALKYGGGKVGGMGAGIYIVYPAFFTDVTENYQLPRWSRVRTDVGGFYFNLIFGLAIMGIYALTGEEFLLFVVALVNLQIIQQLMPFVRLDGYWTLADITGVPDFFSQMGGFLRSILPSWVPFPDGPKMPPLKTWAKFFFLGYILITIPLLLIVLLFMIRAIPRLLGTAFDSMSQQWDKISDASGSGDILGIVAGALQILILALPILGMFYILGFSLGRSVAIAVWRWSKQSAPRAVTGTFGSAAFVALVAFLWIPQLPPLPGFSQSAPVYRALDFDPIDENERFAVGDVLQDERRPFDEDLPVDPDDEEDEMTPDDEGTEEDEAAPDPTETPGAEEDPEEEDSGGDGGGGGDSGGDGGSEPPPEPTSEPTAEPTAEPTTEPTAEASGPTATATP